MPWLSRSSLRLGAAGAVAASRVLVAERGEQGGHRRRCGAARRRAERAVRRAEAGAEEPHRRGGRDGPPDRGAGRRAQEARSTRTSSRCSAASDCSVAASMAARGTGHFGLLETAASYLGLTEAELRDALAGQDARRDRQGQGQDRRRSRASSSSPTQRSGSTKRSPTAGSRKSRRRARDGTRTSGCRSSSTASFAGAATATQHRFWPGVGSPRAPPSSSAARPHRGERTGLGVRRIVWPRAACTRNSDEQTPRARREDERAAPVPSPQISRCSRPTGWGMPSLERVISLDP